ncbi:MAG: hypothetical protein RIC49_12860 [Phycisphaerales bacterium]
MAPPALAQCDWQRVDSPNPGDYANSFADAHAADADGSPLYALLLADNTAAFGNPLDYLVYRRDAGDWVALPPPGRGSLDTIPQYFGIHVDEQDRVFIFGTEDFDEPSLQADPTITMYDGFWREPVTINLGIIFGLPTFQRGGEIHAMDTAPDGTMFAVGKATGHARTDDGNIPLFMINRGGEWVELVPETMDFPGALDPSTILTDVRAFAADDVWAVGAHGRNDDTGLDAGGLILHWNGSEITIVEDPRTGGEFEGFPLEKMDAMGPNNIIAVGGYVFDGTSAIAHYDGTEWTRVDSPVDDTFLDVAFDEDGTAWATPFAAHPEIAFFDGSSWSARPAPRPEDFLNTLATDGDGAVWLLGQDTDFDSASLVLDCDACPADFNGDGDLDVFDFLAFQNAFDAGCP